MRGAFISWTSAHRRSSELAHALGFEPVFIYRSAKFLPVRYLRQGVATWKWLRMARPEVVMVMQPPAVSLPFVALYCAAHRAVMVGDLHSGVFSDPRWRWARRLVLASLRRFGFAVVPNPELARACEEAGVRTIVCYAYITKHSKPVSRPVSISPDQNYVLVPLTYSFDEPIDEILEAAALVPEVSWVLTGKAPPTLAHRAAPNVVFPGFVSSEEYRRLRAFSTAVLALTTQERTMQSAGFEALADGTPLITSPTRVLVAFFGQAATYARPESNSISAAVRSVLSTQDERRKAMAELRTVRLAGQDDSIQQILRLCRNATSGRQQGSRRRRPSY